MVWIPLAFRRASVRAPTPGMSRSSRCAMARGSCEGSRPIRPSGFCMSLAILARKRLGAMPMEQRSDSPTSSRIACLMASAIWRARGGSCSRPISSQTISSMDGVWATGQQRSTACAMRREVSA